MPRLLRLSRSLPAGRSQGWRSQPHTQPLGLHTQPLENYPQRDTELHTQPRYLEGEVATASTATSRTPSSTRSRWSTAWRGGGYSEHCVGEEVEEESLGGSEDF